MIWMKAITTNQHFLGYNYKFTIIKNYFIFSEISEAIYTSIWHYTKLFILLYSKNIHNQYPNDTLPPILQFKDVFYGHFDVEGEIIDIPPPRYMSDRISAKGRKITGTANTRY